MVYMFRALGVCPRRQVHFCTMWVVVPLLGVVEDLVQYSGVLTHAGCEGFWYSLVEEDDYQSGIIAEYNCKKGTGT